MLETIFRTVSYVAREKLSSATVKEIRTFLSF